MDFNVKKSKIVLFNSRGTTLLLLHYSLQEYELEIGEEVKYLGGHHSVRYEEVHCPESYSFIQRKLMTANQQLGMIKRALY